MMMIFPFFLLSTNEKPVASDRTKKKTAFTGVFQEVPIRRYHKHSHAHTLSKTILLYDFVDAWFSTDSLFNVHPSRNMLSHQLCVGFYVRAQCPVQDCHLPFIWPAAYDAAWVNCECILRWDLHVFIQIIDIGQDQWSIDAIVRPPLHSPTRSFYSKKSLTKIARNHSHSISQAKGD